LIPAGGEPGPDMARSLKQTNGAPLSLVGVKAVLITPKVKSSDYVAILNELIPELPQVRG